MEIVKDGNQWIVYSPTFDYMSCGETQEQALKHFELGLHGTIEECIKVGIHPLTKTKL